MLKLLLIIAICCAINNAAATQLESRIVGGEEKHIALAPHLVSIRYKKNDSTPYEHRCAGTIYSSNIILTTATCVIGLDVNRLHIKAGSTYRSHFDGLLYLVEKVILHPDYNIWFYDNDLALVKLAFPLTDDKPKEIAAITIADKVPEAGRSATIAGWGSTNATAINDFAEVIQVTQVAIVETEVCRAAYGGSRISEAMFCAGGQGRDACLGDAGGALVYQNNAVGLVSWAQGCASPIYPGVYTNLVVFKSWIESETLKLV